MVTDIGATIAHCEKIGATERVMIEEAVRTL